MNKNVTLFFILLSLSTPLSLLAPRRRNKRSKGARARMSQTKKGGISPEIIKYARRAAKTSPHIIDRADEFWALYCGETPERDEKRYRTSKRTRRLRYKRELKEKGIDVPC